MHRLLFSLIPILIACYLYALWSDWFTYAELASAAKRPQFSDYLDLRKTGPVVWEIPAAELEFPEESAQLSLSLNLNALREIPRSREQVDLRMQLRVEGRSEGNAWQDRLVRNKRTTDKPFSPAGAGLWEIHGLGRLEYGLAEVRVPRGEQLRITLDVQVPDGMLMTGRPRLKLVARQGPGDIPYPALGRWLLREGGFWLSLVALGWMTISIWLKNFRIPFSKLQSVDPFDKNGVNKNTSD